MPIPNLKMKLVLMKILKLFHLIKIFIWSKFKMNSEDLDKKIIETFEKRFSSVLMTE
jgi:hypothetical protein